MARPLVLRLSISTVLGLLFLTVFPALAAGQDVTAIVGATIIDGNGGPPIENGTIVMSGNRITAVGPRSQVNVPRGANVIDGSGKYGTPGFIDRHLHLSM